MKKRIILILLFYFTLAHTSYAREINTIIIHHSGVEVDQTAQQINEYHKSIGFDEIGYHFVIKKNGEIEIGRNIEKVGAHAKGRNKNSIGICLTGKDNFTKNQMNSLNKLLEKLTSEFDINKIERHHEECPGKNINVESLNKRYIRAKENKTYYEQYGKATFYRDWSTASGQNMFFHPFAKTCASWFYPLGTKLRVTNLYNSKSVIVIVNDRGPNKNLYYSDNRIIDLSPSAFSSIANLNEGKINVGVQKL